MGKEERFKYNFENLLEKYVGGAEIHASFFHPWRLSFNVAHFTFIFVVPIMYYKIYKFRKLQDTTIQGNLIIAYLYR